MILHSKLILCDCELLLYINIVHILSDFMEVGSFNILSKIQV